MKCYKLIRSKLRIKIQAVLKRADFKKGNLFYKQKK